MSQLDAHLEAALARVERAGRRRTLRPACLAADGRIIREGRSLTDFSSNDYLGLATHPLLAERAREWIARHGTGSGASRLVTGTSEAMLAIEARIAAFKGKDAALVFASGWQANAAAIPALLAALPGAAVFADRLIHASMHAGLAAAGTRQHRFRHNDLDHLEELLATKGAEAPARVILTESVFSMDGDVADLPRLAAIARAHDAIVFVDEAHATGVLGPQGRGLAAGIPGIDVVMGTFSKALGGFGAYVAGSRALGIHARYEVERAHLIALATRLRGGLAALGIDHGASASQIVPAMIGAEHDAMALASALEARGFLAAAIRPPTVPPGTSRLRLALRAGHQESDIDALIEGIAACR
jgi:8-amino-7-oxononanoate synthase